MERLISGNCITLRRARLSLPEIQFERDFERSGEDLFARMKGWSPRDATLKNLGRSEAHVRPTFHQLCGTRARTETMMVQGSDWFR